MTFWANFVPNLQKKVGKTFIKIIITIKTSGYVSIELMTHESNIINGNKMLHAKIKKNNNACTPGIVIVCGPTSIGKTSMGITLAQEVKGEIISADSMQIYKHMDIGTAKPVYAEQRLVPHHMIDIIEPDESFDAAIFAKIAAKTISGLLSQNKTPFIVGGTGLYIKALLHGFSVADPVDPEILCRLKKESKKHPPGFLHKKLRGFDKKSADKIHPNDTFRIVRAIAVFKKTGKPISNHHKDHMFSKKLFNAFKIGLDMDRDKLYQRINIRVDKMLESGFLDEVKKLLEMGFSRDLKPMKSLGYRHMVDYIQGYQNWEEAVRLMKRDTRRYAKRQLTWFRADPEILWVKPGDFTYVQEKVMAFLNNA